MRLRLIGGLVAGTGLVAAALFVGIGPGWSATGTGRSATPADTVRPVPVAATTVAGSPSGDCASSQFVLGAPTTAYGMGTKGTIAEFVTQPIRNAGATCTFRQPVTITVAAATASFSPASVVNAGNATSYTIAAGGSASIVVGAWWYIPRITQSTITPCDARIANVTRVAIPVGSDDLQIVLGFTVPEVCASPAHFSFTVNR